MASIEENTERLDLLQRTLSVEEKQKKRLQDLTTLEKKENEQAQRLKMYEGFTSTNSTLDQEEAHRKELVDDMIKHSTPSNTPTVKVLTNLQGNLKNLII